ncbi:MAG: TIGR04190 family B12-binding domain/radical SAM domain protein [Planctomycetes bacterium]|nr:TIGR04190 family B12-binding domain/radical SAM domain protein [Planctomycetota bacterium]
MFRNPDLLLLHAPSVFDFRERPLLFGPVSDVVPSTPAFEMYPLGFASIAEALQDAGRSVRIVNLAFRMLEDPAFDPEAAIARFRPKVFGIDLHWLVHAHGAVEAARLCKKRHPRTPVLLGGLSASYYHEELLRRPEVDFVLRGDSTEEGVVRLLEALDRGAGLEGVPGLAWKGPDGLPRANPIAPPPEVLDAPRDPYGALFRMSARYADARSLTAIHDWWEHPQFAVLSFRGCRRSCAFCGGAATAFSRFYGRERTGHRPPAAVAEDVRRVSRYSGAPVFLLWDPLEPGEDYARELFERLGSFRVRNEIAVELYRPAPGWFFELLARTVPAFNLEISPETHDEEIRKTCRKGYANEALLDTVERALGAGARRFDLFFMIGLPGQDRASVRATVEWADGLMRRFDRRLVPFVSALTPFLDPGSPIFEDPAAYGYTLLRRTFEEHRRALEEPSWEFVLNYETDRLTRRDIVEATYEAGRRLNDAKLRHGRVTREQHDRVERNAAESEALAAEVRRLHEQPEGEARAAALRALKPRLDAVQSSVVCAKEEFRWPGGGFRWLGIARAVLASALPRRRGPAPSGG